MANGGKSDFLELELLDHVLGAAAYTAPGTIHVALFTVLPSDAGSGGTEVSGGSYARVAVTNNATNWPAASAGQKSNGTAITYPQATANWGNVKGFGLYDASTAGNLLYWGGLVAAAKTFTAVAATDVFTSTAHGYADGQQVRIFARAGAVLPTGISADTVYFVRDQTANTFKLAATLGGAAIDITADGGGDIHADYSKDVNTGDTPSFGVGALVVTED